MTKTAPAVSKKSDSNKADSQGRSPKADQTTASPDEARARLAATGRNDSLPLRLGEEVQEVSPRRRRAGHRAAAGRAGRAGACEPRAGACSSSGARGPPRRSSARRWRSTRTWPTPTSGSGWRAWRPGTPRGRRRSWGSCSRDGEAQAEKLRAEGVKDAFSKPRGAAVHPGRARARLPRLRRGAVRGFSEGPGARSFD